MFNPSVDDVRNFFYDTYEKSNNKQVLSDIEKIAYGVIVKHPEYYNILSNKDKYFGFKWDPSTGETNPFLHMSMHISILEQVSINQPVGIKEIYGHLCAKYDEHNAEHIIMDCLGEMIWQSQVNNIAMDSETYLAGLRSRL